MHIPSACWDIYARQLASLRYGHALWEPSITYPGGGVSVGDVGFLREGVFTWLFNALLPVDDLAHKVNGIPDGFSPLIVPRPVFTQAKSPLQCKTYPSRSVRTVSADVQISGDQIILPEGGISLSLSEGEGAALVLLDKAERYDTFRLGPFKKYMQDNCRNWLQFANDRHGFDISLHDLFFVTGCDVTTKWATTAYSWNEGKIDAGLGVRAPGVVSAHFSLQGGWKTEAGVHRNCGPQNRLQQHNLESTDSPDQCVFIRGFRAKERFFKSVKIKAAAGFDERGQDKDADENSAVPAGSPSSSTVSSDDSGVDIEKTPGETENYNLLASILDYILQDERVDVAIAHDEDLIHLMQHADFNELEHTLESQSPSVIIDPVTGCGSLDLVYDVGATAHAAETITAGDFEPRDQLAPSNTERIPRKDNFSWSAAATRGVLLSEPHPERICFSEDGRPVDTPWDFCLPTNLPFSYEDAGWSSPPRWPGVSYGSELAFEASLDRAPPPWGSSPGAEVPDSVFEGSCGSSLSVASFSSMNTSPESISEGSSGSPSLTMSSSSTSTSSESIFEGHTSSKLNRRSSSFRSLRGPFSAGFSTMNLSPYSNFKGHIPSELLGGLSSSRSVGTDLPLVQIVEDSEGGCLKQSVNVARPNITSMAIKQAGEGRRSRLDDRRYKCQMCGSTFTRKANLDEHLTGRPLLCASTVSSRSRRRSSPYVNVTSSPVGGYSDTDLPPALGQMELKAEDSEGGSLTQGIAVARPNVTSPGIKQASEGRRIKPAPHKCAVCGSRFMRKVNLDEHLTAHKGEKPYPCDFGTCSKAFARLNDLNRHRKIHEKEGHPAPAC